MDGVDGVEGVVGADDSDADFDAGFKGEATVIPPPPPEPTPEPEPKEESKAEPTPAEQYVQITQSQWDDLMGRAAKIDEIAATQTNIRDTAMGKIGGIERTLNELRSGGGVSEEDLAELRDQYPELAELKIFKNLKPSAAAPAVDAEQISRLVREHSDPIMQSFEQRVSVEVETRLLDALHPEWREVVGLPDGDKQAPETEFRKWLKTQPQEYADAVLGSDKMQTISKAIKTFEASKKQVDQPALDTGARQRRIAAATHVKGDSAPVSAEPSDDEMFDIGFKTRR